MRTKLVKRYWCDFCNKAGLSAGAMAKHEKHCTMNPNRECRVCKMVEAQGHTLVSLIAMLPDSRPYIDTCSGYDDDNHVQGRFLSEAVAAVLPEFRKQAENCPACMMAAFRQAKIPLPMVDGFNFTEEMKSIWADINAAQAHNEGCY